MRLPGGHELPEDLRPVMSRAVRLERITVVYIASVIVVVYLVLGSSQAMKAVWVEDILTLFPSLAFLIASRFRHKPATADTPFGYHRSVSVADLIGAAAILALGGYIGVDSAIKLIEAEHPSIGLVELFDFQVWQGWLMLAALLYTGIPTVLLGRMKQPLADELHDKVLYADAEMMRADWMTACAAMVGVIGIGLGFWWLDAVAALLISVDIVHDGVRNVRAATRDLMDARPHPRAESAAHPVLRQIEEAIAGMSWIDHALLRFREDGHLLAGEVLVVPATDECLTDRVEETIERLRSLDWKLEDVVVVPVRELRDLPEGMEPVRGGGAR